MTRIANAIGRQKGRWVVASALVLATLGAGAALATGDPAHKAEMIQLIRDQGCEMTDQQADDVFDPLGYTYDEINTYLDEMIAAGEATFDGKIVVLSEALCAAAPSKASQD